MAHFGVLLVLCFSNFVLSVYLPPSPCTEYFNYYRSQNGVVFGKINVRNNNEGEYLLVVNMTLPLITQKTIQIKRVTNEIQIRNGADMLYDIIFPFVDILPVLTSLTFNGKVVCVGNNVLDRSRGLTMLSVFDYFKITQNKFSTPWSNLNINPVSDNSNFFQTNEPVTHRIEPIEYKPTTQQMENHNLLTLFTSKPTEIDPFRVDTPSAPIPPNNQNFFVETPSAPVPSNNQNIFSEKPSVSIQSNSQNFFSECGIADDIKPLIVNGRPTKSGEYPWLVAMFKVEASETFKFHCAANLVSSKHVITAAHCLRYKGVETVKKDDIVLVFGKHNIKNWATRSTIRAVKSIDIHPEYYQPGDADIAILRLDEEVMFADKIRPICLWQGDNRLESVVNKRGTVVGWGKDEYNNEYVGEPRQLEMPIVSQEDCLRSDDRFLKITSNRTFCAGDKSGASPCSGDSGGGFLMRINARWYLRGIVSVALNDQQTQSCDSRNYIVFSDAAKNLDWIQRTLRSSK